MRTDVQAIDALTLSEPQGQQEQLIDGTLMLPDAALTTLRPKESQTELAMECISLGAGSLIHLR